MSKSLLNFLVKISKALVNSKIQFLIQKSFFFTFGLATLTGPLGLRPSRPRWPLSSRRPKPTLPALARRWHICKKICFLLWFTPSVLGAFSLSTRWHMGPTCRFRLLHHAGQPRPCLHHAAAPCATRSAPRIPVVHGPVDPVYGKFFTKIIR
jgi:hypothetical protein